jgi:serine/threonine protein kinase/lipopolysaccharide biosynthesis regulator YciM
MDIGADYDRQVMTLLARARALSPDERADFLREAGDGDAQLMEEVSDTLAWEERMGSFLAAPLIDFISLARPFQPGDLIAQRFEIRHEIGEGGMGVVYEAYDRTRKQKIAIKAAKPGFQAVLSPELEGALKVRHPNICLVNEIHTAVTKHGPIEFLTMELLEGQTLAAHLAKHGKLAPAEALHVARQICAGLAEAHRSNIIHRDLKAANIMLCPAVNGGTRVVIMDFGLAGDVTPELAEIGGTPAYMAPELLRGARTSKASDIYALGVILHEISVGGQPGPEPRKSGDARWDRTIRRCLDASPQARFQTATEVMQDLEKKLFSKERLLVAGLALTGLLAVASQQPDVHQWLAERFWPARANVRLAVLPVAGPDDTSVVMSGILHDVSGRLSKMHSDRRTVVVLSPREVLDNQVRTVEQAKTILNATHVLQTAVKQDGNDLVMHASVINLDTQVSMGESSGRYSLATAGNMPSALAGTVSRALRLQRAAASESLNAAAAVPYAEGLNLLRSGENGYVNAIALLERAARLDPRSTLPLAELVEARIAAFRVTKNAADIEAARRALQAAESIDPDSVAVLLAAGRLFETTGEYEKARENYQRVRELDPRNVDAYLRMAGVEDTLNMPERAIDSYRKAIALEPGYFKPYHHFGVFYYYRGKYRDAAEQFQKSIERAPGRVDAYADLAAALNDGGEDEQAEQALRKSLEIRETADAWNSLGVIRAHQKNDAEAVEHFRRAARSETTNYIYLLNTGDSARRLGLRAEAALAYRNALTLARAELAQNPRLGTPRAFVAYLEAQLGDAQRAADDIAEALQFSPGDSKVMRRAVLTYEALGRHDDSLEVIAKASPELLRELDRHPDLANFSKDPRFRELVDTTSRGQ